MDGDIMMIIILSSLFSFLILYFLISSATLTKQRNWHEQVQTKLLTKIAEKQGVSEEEIKQCFNVRM
jgi:hypothetical protein